MNHSRMLGAAAVLALTAGLAGGEPSGPSVVPDPTKANRLAARRNRGPVNRSREIERRLRQEAKRAAKSGAA